MQCHIEILTIISEVGIIIISVLNIQKEVCREVWLIYQKSHSLYVKKRRWKPEELARSGVGPVFIL